MDRQMVKEKLVLEFESVSSRLRGATGQIPVLPNHAADEVDVVQESLGRELSFAARALLIEKGKRIEAALVRLDRGEYGVCVECTEDIAEARLRVIPEVETCVRCQDRLERSSRQQNNGTIRYKGERADDGES